MPTRRGHFAYESGHHGDLWLDLDALFARPAALRPHTDRLAGRLRPYGPEVVCGPLVGGAYAAQLVAEALDTAFCWSAPEPGGYALALPATVAGRRVAIVDDAVNAGCAVTSTAAALTAAGARVVAVGALLTLGAAPASVAGAPVESLATVPSHLWPAPHCPRCAEGAPLEQWPA